MKTRSYWLAGFAAVLILVLQAGTELWMGRVPWCTCGTIKLWHGVVNSAENSQHITDWYTPSHVIHGFIFYALAHLLLPRVPLPVRLLCAMAVETGWEILENTDLIINRYRAATIALDYYGDSIINSLSDSLACLAGFFLAARLPVWATVALALLMELLVGAAIRDNLTLNIIMLLFPNDTIRAWQMGG